MTTGLANENADEEKAKLNMEPMVEVLPKQTVEPSLYAKIRTVSMKLQVLVINIRPYLRVLVV